MPAATYWSSLIVLRLGTTPTRGLVINDHLALAYARLETSTNLTTLNNVNSDSVRRISTSTIYKTVSTVFIQITENILVASKNCQI